jgi:hypothetical protein
MGGGGGGGAQRPILRGNESKKTGARTRGQNPLVNNKSLDCEPDFLTDNFNWKKVRTWRIY